MSLILNGTKLCPGPLDRADKGNGAGGGAESPSTILRMLFDHCPFVPHRYVGQKVTTPHPNTDAGGRAEHIHLLISCR
jgi:hypothetical protein